MAKVAPSYLGPYRLLNVVHSGHSCQLWQAYDGEFDRMVGIKTLLERFRTDRQQLRYLRTEYLVGKNLHHPCVIGTYGFELNDGYPYLALEWFSAPNMKQRIQQGIGEMAPLLPKIVEGAAEALAHFHRMGWIHRDIKPDNFLVADDGSVKLIDFALAVRPKRGFVKWFARRSKVQGTRSYMAPEQIRGEAVDERTDLYSFACTIFELLSARPPFTGISTNDLLIKHLKAPPPSMESVSSIATPELSQLIRRSMAKDPNTRPKSVDVFLNEFRMIRPFKAAKSTNL